MRILLLNDKELMINILSRTFAQAFIWVFLVCFMWLGGMGTLLLPLETVEVFTIDCIGNRSGHGFVKRIFLNLPTGFG